MVGPFPKTLASCLSIAALTNGNKDALTHEEKTVTYKQLKSSVNNFAQHIFQLHPNPGTRIAIIANKDIDTVIAMLAVLHTKAILVIINPLLKFNQIDHILSDSDASTLLCKEDWALTEINDRPFSSNAKLIFLHQDTLNNGKKNNRQISNSPHFQYKKTAVDFFNADCNLRKYSKQASELSPAFDFPNSEDVAAILYTSGSSGKPKGVVLSHSNLWHGADSIVKYLKNTETDRILSVMPLSFDYGFSQLSSSIHASACLVLHDYVLPKLLVKAISEYKITGLAAVPHLWDLMMRIEWPMTSSLRYVTSTGGRLQVATIKTMRRRLPNTQLFSMYGFTEAFRATYLLPEDIDNHPESIGKAVPHASVMVVDSEGNELPAGEIGELIQSGPLVSLGYWRDPESTAHKFKTQKGLDGKRTQRFAWSGDLCFTDENGLLYFATRKDDLLKLNGFRTSPTEIELELLACPFILQAAVVCIPKSRVGNTPIAFVVATDQANDLSLDAWAFKNLPNFMQPKLWILVEELPLTPNNKIDKPQLLSRIDKSKL